MEVLCAVVTYNRLQLLQKCIHAILEQSIKPDTILVINNNSTDGTKEWLDSQKNLVSIHQENSGGSGGFFTAIQYGISNDYQWFWLMDDDGRPDPFALENLLKHKKKNVSALNSLVLSNQNPEKLAFGMPRYDEDGNMLFKPSIKNVTELKKTSKDGQTVVFGNFFNGTLIKNEVIQKIGNVNRDLFIWGDELDLEMRLFTIAPVLTVLDAIHYHPEPFGQAPVWKLFYGLRNHIYLIKHYYNSKLLRIMKLIFLLGPHFFKQKGGWKYFFKALKDGFTEKLGKVEFT